MLHLRFVIPLILLTLIGCAVEETPVQTAAPDLPPSLFLTSPPANARSVAEVKESAALGDEVVIAGQLVGNRQIFVEGAATFILGDRSIEACHPEEGCDTPWDACCTPITERRALSATIQVVGEDGKPLRTSLKGRGALSELKQVVVVGKVSQRSEGVFVVDASGIFVAGGDS